MRGKISIIKLKGSFSTLCSIIITCIIVTTVINQLYLENDRNCCNGYGLNDIFKSLHIKSNIVERNCTRKSNIVFLKTHKCASSTIQNIFMRFGLINHKVFALPSEGNYFGHPQRFSKAMVPNKKTFNGQYNILTHHMRFDYKAIRSVMPNDTVYVTIVRDPVDLFESMFIYYRLNQLWNFTLDKFANDSFSPPKSMFKYRYGNKIGLNQMMFDLGFDENQFFNATSVDGYIQYIDSIFDLVMVAEHMHESLILLKDLLCWTIDDIISFKINSRISYLKNNLNKKSRNRIRRLNLADNRLYTYFKAKFMEKIKKYGRKRISSEVQSINKLVREYYKYCVEEYTADESVILKFRNKHEENSTCQLLVMSELTFTDNLRIMQKTLFPGSVLTPKRRFPIRKITSKT